MNLLVRVSGVRSIRRLLPGIPACLVFFQLAAGLAATRFVSPDSAFDGPGTNWNTAFHQIQGGIDAATNTSDIVLVADGVYATGSRVTPGASLLNRIVATNGITIRSLSGAAATVIQGAGPQGDSAVRCAYLSGGAKLIGFTLSNGFTRAGGDAYLDRSGGGAYATNGILSNCVVIANSAEYSGGGVFGGRLIDSAVRFNSSAYGWGGGICGAEAENTAIVSNYAYYGGGGAYGATLSYCPVNSNKSYSTGGGIYGGVAVGCMVDKNSVTLSGGGVFGGQISRSTITANTAPGGQGGGCYSSLVYNCTISGNTALYGGGGTYGGVVSNSVICSNSATSAGGGGTMTGCVVNCVIFANSGAGYGGGVVASTLSNCTVVANTATLGGGGMYIAFARNSIIYGNSAPSYTDCQGGTLAYCCTGSDPGGVGNITSAPDFTDGYHLNSNSLCIAAGNNLYAPAGLDMDGHARIRGSFVDIGAYESPYVIVNVAAMENGSIVPSGRVPAEEFTSPVFAINAAAGYYVSNVTVDGQSIGGVAYYQFFKISSNHTLGAGSALLPTGPTNVINAFAGFGGTITPSGAVMVPRGSSQLFTITASRFATISDVWTNGVSIGATNSVLFDNVTTNHSICAFFFTYVDTNGFVVTRLSAADPSKFVLSWVATNDWAYTLQCSLSLTSPSWSNVPPHANRIGCGELAITNNLGTNSPVFYRLKAWKYQ